ncbi:MAG: hypothetical protein WB041_04815 [Pseudolabrys sp.]
MSRSDPRKTCKHVPTGTILAIEAEGCREVVDTGFALVGAITFFAQPEEALANHEFGQRLTILALSSFVYLFAKGFECRFAYRFWRRDRDGFVRARLVGGGGCCTRGWF